MNPNPYLGKQAPAGAVRLTMLNEWESVAGGPMKWRDTSGYFEVAPGTGDICTKRRFGDCIVHVEWRTPSKTVGADQKPGNSGVWMMGLYELQILDSYRNQTYPDGQAAAIYGQHPPRVNASAAPGEWQTFDITWRRPRFDEGGRVKSKAVMTVLHNGILVHKRAAMTGPTAHKKLLPYKAHDDRLPLKLQDHGEPVRFRNIWVKPLE